jgi:hypothetical protein
MFRILLICWFIVFQAEATQLKITGYFSEDYKKTYYNNGETFESFYDRLRDSDRHKNMLDITRDQYDYVNTEILKLRAQKKDLGKEDYQQILKNCMKYVFKTTREVEIGYWANRFAKSMFESYLDDLAGTKTGDLPELCCASHVLWFENISTQAREVFEKNGSSILNQQGSGSLLAKKPLRTKKKFIERDIVNKNKNKKRLKLNHNSWNIYVKKRKEEEKEKIIIVINE